MSAFDQMPDLRDIAPALDAARRRASELQAGPETDAIIGKLLGREAAYSTDPGAMWAAVEWAAFQQDIQTWERDRWIGLRWTGPEYKPIGAYMTADGLGAEHPAWWCSVVTYWHTRVVFADARPMMAVCRAVAYIGWVHEAVAEIGNRAPQSTT
ncbi:hypothetical protein [Sorangium sp. So ce1024]|uniref:hypothetical protein n=1 Tax=Sorangium sp. So ce1024 TaxID=3133327 RepID=UPI003F0C8CF9